MATRKAEDRFVGRTKDGDRVFISMELRHRGPEFTTTGEPIIKMTRDHRAITEYDELSISGCIVPKGCRNAYTFGQIQDMLNPHTMQSALPAGVLSSILALWEHCHLNGMHAGCIHQDDHVPVPSGVDWKALYAEQTAKCPHGYKYGSRWLVEALTDHETELAEKAIDALANQPQYTGN